MPQPEPALVAFLVAALGSVAGFLGYLIRDYISTLKKQLDTATSGWQSQTAATEKLADALVERNKIDRERGRSPR